MMKFYFLIIVFLFSFGLKAQEGGCGAKIAAPTGIKANPLKSNGFFRFDYKIISNIKIKQNGHINTLNNVVFYVNSEDGSIFYPKETLKKIFQANISNSSGSIDGAVRLSDNRMVTFINDAIYHKKRAVITSTHQSADNVYINEHIAWSGLFNDIADQSVLPVKKEQDILPANSQWRDRSKGYTGTIYAADQTTDMTLYFADTTPDIPTGHPMVGFLVGVVKNPRKGCNQLVVFNRVENAQKYIQAELLQITKSHKSFNATNYKPGDLFGGLNSGAGGNAQNMQAKMAEYQQKAIALGNKIRSLQKEKSHCIKTIKGDPSPCNERYDPQIQKAKDDAKALQYQMLKSMGAEDMLQHH